jgi:glutamyl-tRNA synthetase
MVLPYLQRAGYVTSPPPCSISEKLTAIVTAAGDRIKVAGDILDYRTFFTADSELTYDESAFDKRIRKQAQSAGLLAKFSERLRTLDRFDAATLEKSLHDFVQAEGIEIGQVIHPLRVAATGQSVGFGLFETMAILGRESCITRIQQALARTNH